VPPPTDTQTPTPMLAKETPTTPPAPTATPTETPVIPSPEAVFEIGYVGINRGRKPLDDVRVRQAVAHAIDKWYIVGTLYPPTAEVATQFIPPGIFGHTEGQEYHDYDPDKAKQLLAEAGYPDGFKTTLWVMPVSRGYYPTPDEIGEVMKSQLAAVGIEADTLILDWALYREKVPAGEADLFMLGWTFDSNDGTHLLDNLFGMGADQRFGPHFPELEQMLAQGASTVGAAERQSIYDKVNQFIYENAIVVPIVHP
jgi:peptide/nickel transport system substrate-binding protein